MKKHTYLLFASLLLPLIGFSQNKKSDLEKSELKGKIKTFKQSYYQGKKVGNTVVTDKLTEGGFLEEFNENGNRISTCDVAPDGTLSGKKYLKYDDKQNLIEELTPGDSVNPTKKKLYLRNEDGSIMQENFYTGTALTQKTMYSYNNQGKEIERKIIFKNALYSKRLSQYDKAGNLIEEDNYKGDTAFDGKHVYTYDLKGNMIEDDVFTKERNLDSKIHKTYNEKGVLIKWENHDKNDKLQWGDSTIYNKDGVMLEYDSYYIDTGVNHKETYQYEYDNKGNCIKKITSKENGKIGIVMREITYY
jgi:hypothetical protein